VQLWYQMAVNGRRDLGAAPSPRAGFEMALLRMLAFRPAADSNQLPAPMPRTDTKASMPPPAPTTAARMPVPAPATAVPLPVPVPVPVPAAKPARPAETAALVAALQSGDEWLQLLSRAGLKGPVLQLASHSAFCGHQEGMLRLFLPEEDLHLRNDKLVRQLSDAVSELLGTPTQIRFEAAASAAGDTLHARNQRQRSERQVAAETSFMADPVVNQLLGQGGSLVPDSIRPNNEN
jgi:DNA polymerase-3 subunit gamma/tau